MAKGSHGLSESWLLTRGRFRAQTPERTPEQRAAYEATMAKADAHFNRPLEPGERGYAGPAEANPQQRALSRLVDREARIAVEGDTDLNHANLEG